MINDLMGCLSTLLDERRELLESLLALAAKHTAALAAEDVSSLDGVLQQKQQLIDSVDKLEAKSDLIWGELSQTQGVSDWSDLLRYQPDSPLLQKRAAIAALLGELLQIDAEHERLGQQLLVKLEQELQVVNRSAAASKTYAQAGRESAVPAIFANRKL